MVFHSLTLLFIGVVLESALVYPLARLMQGRIFYNKDVMLVDRVQVCVN